MSPCRGRRRDALTAIVLASAVGIAACTEPSTSDDDADASGGATSGGIGGSSGADSGAGASSAGRLGTTGGTSGAAGAGAGGGAAGSAAGGGAGGQPVSAGGSSSAGVSGSVAGGGQGGSSSGGAGVNAGTAGTAIGGSAGIGAAGSAGNGAAGSTGGTGGGVAGAAGSAGTGTSCASAAYAICEDFESSADGAVPSGWTKVGAVGTASDAAHGGTKSLKVGAATSGARRMRLTGARVTMLGGAHWGRLFYKVQTPAPAPTNGVIHSTIVAWDAQSPISGTNEVRVVDTVEDTQGRHQYLYNVQTSDRGEFGKGSAYDFSYDGAWYCVEWTVDYATQRYRFFLDGEELSSIGVMNGAGNFQNSELPPAFTALSIGWNNYQQAPSPGFVAWIDDVAIGSERVGCN